MENEDQLLLYSIFIAIIYMILFFDKAPGISVPIFSVVSVLFFLGCFKQREQLKNTKVWVFLILIFLLAFRFAFSDNGFFGFFNKHIVIVLFITMALVWTQKEVDGWGSTKFLGKIILAVFLPLGYFLRPYRHLYSRTPFRKKLHAHSPIVKVGLGILISIPILLIIGGLLASADMVFEELLSFFPSFVSKVFSSTSFVEWLIKVIFAVLVGTYAYCFIYNLFVMQREEQIEIDGQDDQPKQKLAVDSIVWMTILIMIGFVYVVFCVIQFSYLFGGSAGSVLPGDFTYAEYARRGFFELLLVTMMNFSIILFSIYFTDPKTKRIKQLLKMCLVVVGIATYVMIYSSFYRMNLYQQNYGYTYLRIFVYFFLSLETVLLAVTLYYMIKPRFSLIKICSIVSLGFYIGLNYMNIDQMIAKSNIDRYFETGKIDIEYLKDLPLDAAPQMQRLLDVKDLKIKQEVQQYFEAAAEYLEKEHCWQSWNTARYQADKILSEQSLKNN